MASDPVVEELWGLANGSPLDPGVLQARWLLRGVVNGDGITTAEPPKAPEPVKINGYSPVAWQSIIAATDKDLEKLRAGKPVTKACVYRVGEARRVDEALTILESQGRLAEWPYEGEQA